ncbi:MAG: hypothetical protein QNK15_04330 [Cycloclasticus sp.]|nr:hypothetical protein [Cycloclasticus sp.]
MKIIRVIFLLVIFVVAAFYTKLQRLESTAWIDPLRVLIYPINADGQQSTSRYIAALTKNNFKSVGLFFNKQWSDYSDYEFDPIKVQLSEPIHAQPPEPPTDGNTLKIIFWSLRLRLWSYQNAIDSDSSTINIFVRYQQVDDHKPMSHSLGLQKGLIGVVNAYAVKHYQEQNNIVLAHELLHTVGASDKYNLKTGQPIYPEGFANSDVLYGQSRAEIMAGKIPLSENDSVMPESLRNCVIGSKTAAEIGWLSRI